MSGDGITAMAFKITGDEPQERVASFAVALYRLISEIAPDSDITPAQAMDACFICMVAIADRHEMIQHLEEALAEHLKVGVLNDVTLRWVKDTGIRH